MFRIISPQKEVKEPLNKIPHFVIQVTSCLDKLLLAVRVRYVNYMSSWRRGGGMPDSAGAGANED